MYSAANRNAFVKYCETIDGPTSFRDVDMDKIGTMRDVVKMVNGE